MAAVVQKSLAPLEKRNTAKKTAVQNLRPAKRHLDRIETERIYRVIQDGNRYINEIYPLTCLLKKDHFIFIITDVELRDLLFKHQALVKQFQETDELIVEKIQNSFREILRCMRFKGVSLNEVFTERKKQNRLQPFIQKIEELRCVTYERLLTEAHDEDSLHKYILQTMEKSRNSQKVINHLSDVLRDKTAEKEHLLNEKDLVIRQLKLALNEMIAAANEENNSTLNDAAKQILTDNKTLANKQSKLQEEIIDTSDRLYKDRKTNYSNEAKLRKRKFKMAGELHNWIMKYDQDMQWRQDEIDDLNQLHKQDLEEMKQLEEHFAKLEKEHELIMEERLIKREEELKREKYQKKLRMAVIKIQAFWRGCLVRQKMPGKKKGGKGGKKGRKKK